MFLPPLFYLKSAWSKFKKIAIVCIVFFAIIQLFLYFWFKNDLQSQTDLKTQTRTTIYKTINDPELKKTEEGQLYIGLYRSYMCGMIGEACTNNPSDAQYHVQNSFAGQVSKLLTFPYQHPPASGMGAVYASLQHAGFVPQTYAAEGIGFASIAPFRPLWLITRNFIFLIMVLVIVAMGFMIMFRTKINPQTVITVENALPKIALALLIITFSYAIAGFLIDLMYILMGLIVGLFSTEPRLGFKASDILNQAFYGESGGLLGAMFNNNIGGLATAIYDVIPDQITGVINSLVAGFGLQFGLVIFGASGNLIGSLIHPNGGFKPKNLNIKALFEGIKSSLKGVSFLKRFAEETQDGGMPVISLIAALIIVVLGGAISNTLAPFLTQAIIWLILMFSLLFIFFRIFFMFLSVYVQILLLIIFAPAILALEVLPGRSAFASWLKSLTLHLSTFPIFLLLVLASKAVMSTPADVTLWKPPFTYGFESNAFKTIIAMALLYMSPEFIKMFKEMTGVKPMSSALNLGAFFSGATAAVGGGLGLASQVQSLRVMWLGYGQAHEGGLQGTFGKLLGGIANRGGKKPAEAPPLPSLGADTTSNSGAAKS